MLSLSSLNELRVQNRQFNIEIRGNGWATKSGGGIVVVMRAIMIVLRHDESYSEVTAVVKRH